MSGRRNRQKRPAQRGPRDRARRSASETGATTGRGHSIFAAVLKLNGTMARRNPSSSTDHAAPDPAGAWHILATALMAMRMSQPPRGQLARQLTRNCPGNWGPWYSKLLQQISGRYPLQGARGGPRWGPARTALGKFCEARRVASQMRVAGNAAVRALPGPARLADRRRARWCRDGAGVEAGARDDRRASRRAQAQNAKANYQPQRFLIAAR